jgi:hypothetical protein
VLLIGELSTNHKCTQPCYFHLLYKTVAQKVKIDWNSSMRSPRMCAALIAVPKVFWSLPLFHSIRESSLVFRDIIYVIYILYL